MVIDDFKSDASMAEAIDYDSDEDKVLNRRKDVSIVEKQMKFVKTKSVNSAELHYKMLFNAFF